VGAGRRTAARGHLGTPSGGRDRRKGACRRRPAGERFVDPASWS